MKIVKPNWDIFKAKFSENPQENFEWFCYLLFSKEYNQPYGTHRYKNQAGIETDPIEVGDEVIGWQSKFYEDTLSNHKDDLLGTLTKTKIDNPNITKIILYTNSEWGQGQGTKEPKAKIEIEEKAKELNIELNWRVRSYFESPFVCITNGNISKYFFMQESFVPSFELISKKTKLNIKGAGKRYAPNDIKYESLNQSMPISNIFNFIDNHVVMKYINNIGYDLLQNRPFTIKSDILGYIKTLKTEIPKEIKKFLKNIQSLEKYLGAVEQYKYDVEPVYGKLGGTDPQEELNLGYFKINELKKRINNQKTLLKKLSRKDLLFYEKNILLISGEALIGKTHLFCDIAISRLENNQQTLLFFGNKFDGNKYIVKNMIEQLGLTNINEDEFLEALDLWANKYGNRTLIMIDAINETENSKIWQEGIIKFCEQIKSYPNLALAMSIRDVEKNKVITPENEEYIANEIVEVEHKGFEGIELEAVRTFCEALEVEFPKVPIHTYRLFVNPGMLFLYIETIKNSTNKVDTSIINPLTIFKSYVDDLERKYYQKYPHDIDEEDEVVSEAIKEFISLGTQKDYLHFYLDYKEVKKKLKPLHNKILEFLISEGVLNKLNQESGTRVYFTYQKFENFFIANYLLNDFEAHKDKIRDILFGYDNNALVEAFFMQIPQKLGHEPFDLYPNILDEYELCILYFDSLVWRETRYFTDETFKYIEKIQNDWEGISSKYLDVILQLSSIPNHPLNILSFHQKLLDMTMLERDYDWSIKIHNLFMADKIVKRIINWAWDKKEEFEIEDESLYLYGLTLGWFLTSSNRELRDGATKALVNLFTDRVDVFLNVLKKFETVDDLYVLERLYAVGYGIVLRSSKQNGFKELGEYVYQAIFDKDKVVEHVLIRDYARLVIEYIDDIHPLDVDINKVMPPYNSSMPNVYPTLEEIKEYEKKGIGASNITSSMRTESMGDYGDFGRYTFQSSLISFDKRDEVSFQDLSNYACKVIFEDYITDAILFETLEDEIRDISYERNKHKVERIGKKYQWLAMYKVLAKVADNYKVRDDTDYDTFLDYTYASRLGIRNIDISTILREKKTSDNEWWDRVSNSFETPDLTDTDWLQSKENLPTLNEVVNISEKSKEYLVLDTFFSKSGNKDKEEYRHLNYSVYAYFVKKEHMSDILDWLSHQNFYGNDIAETSSISPIFIREYPNSKVYDEINCYYHGQNSWDKGYGHRSDVLPSEVLLCSTEYLQENAGYDYSLKETIQFKIPNKWLINNMKLNQSLSDGEWCNEKGEVVFFDPSLYDGNRSVLMANKDLLLKFLDENEYSIFWTLNGEKMMRETNYELSSDIPFRGYGAISGYAYFEEKEFIENISIKLDNGRN